MDKILNPDFGLMFWTWITFSILVFVLSKVVWGPVVKAMREREGKIQGDLSAAKQSKVEAEKLQAQFEAQLAEAQKTIQAMMAQARSEADQARHQIVDTAKQEAERLLEKGRKDLAGETERLKAELQAEVGALSVLIAEKMLQRSVNADVQKQVLQESLKSLAGSPR